MPWCGKSNGGPVPLQRSSYPGATARSRRGGFWPGAPGRKTVAPPESESSRNPANALPASPPPASGRPSGRVLRAGRLQETFAERLESIADYRAAPGGTGLTNEPLPLSERNGFAMSIGLPSPRHQTLSTALILLGTALLGSCSEGKDPAGVMKESTVLLSLAPGLREELVPDEARPIERIRVRAESVL